MMVACALAATCHVSLYPAPGKLEAKHPAAHSLYLNPTTPFCPTLVFSRHPPLTMLNIPIVHCGIPWHMVNGFSVRGRGVKRSLNLCCSYMRPVLLLPVPSAGHVQSCQRRHCRPVGWAGFNGFDGWGMA